MDKREGLRAGITEMRSVAQRLMTWADDLEASFQDPEATEQEVPAAEPVPAPKRRRSADRKPVVGKEAAGSAADEEKSAAEPVVPAVVRTLPEVRAILAEKCAAGFGTQVKALIESYGACTLKEVPAEKYEEMLEAVRELGSGGDADAG